MNKNLTLLFCFSAAFSIGYAQTDADLEAKATAIQSRIFTVDTHIDTPTASLRRKGWELTQRHDVATDFSQCDFPRMKEGGLKSAFFAVFLSQGTRTPEGLIAARDSTLKIFMFTRTALARYPNECELALTADDGPRIAATGKRAIYLSIENGYAIGKDITLVKTYYTLGARMMGITHFANNDLGDSATDAKGKEWGGLSPLGKDVVAECNRLGIIVDASHSADSVLDDLISLSKTPIILSHSGCKAVYNHARNVTDEQLRKLAASGGVIQMNTLSAYLIPTPPNPQKNEAMGKLMAKFGSFGDMSDEQLGDALMQMHKLQHDFPDKKGTIDDFMTHLLHAIEVARIDHVGIGSDMDGGGGLIGLEDVSDYTKITLELLKHGYPEEDIAKVWGGNMLRLMKTAEDYARQVKPAATAPAKA